MTAWLQIYILRCHCNLRGITSERRAIMPLGRSQCTDHQFMATCCRWHTQRTPSRHIALLLVGAPQPLSRGVAATMQVPWLPVS
jgi:hypothetical protein